MRLTWLRFFFFEKYTFEKTPLKVDEAEIFEGGENKLTMTQAYTWEFQCQYKLQKYPFDTQVLQRSRS